MRMRELGINMSMLQTMVEKLGVTWCEIKVL